MTSRSGNRTMCDELWEVLGVIAICLLVVFGVAWMVVHPMEFVWSVLSGASGVLLAWVLLGGRS